MSVIVRDKGAKRIVEVVSNAKDLVVDIGIIGAKADAPKRVKKKIVKTNKRGDVLLNVADDGSVSAQTKDVIVDAEDGATMAEIATYHEFGIGVPQRSFLRAWADQDRQKIEATLRRLTVRVIAGKLTREQAYEQFGGWAQGQVQKFIADGRVQPPLDQRTIDAKGSSKPLIDTGQLRSSITYEVRTP